MRLVKNKILVLYFIYHSNIQFGNYIIETNISEDRGKKEPSEGFACYVWHQNSVKENLTSEGTLEEELTAFKKQRTEVRQNA